MPGAKYRHIQPNADHTLSQGLPEILSSITSHLNAIIQSRPRPNIKWSSTPWGALAVYSDQKPSKVQIYRGESITSKPNRRDFRWITANIEGACQPPAAPINDEICSNPIKWIPTEVVGEYNPQTKTYNYKYQEPTNADYKNWVSYFFMLDYPDGQSYTTQAVIMPDIMPFKACGAGEACIGTLV